MFLSGQIEHPLQRAWGVLALGPTRAKCERNLIRVVVDDRGPRDQLDAACDAFVNVGVVNDCDDTGGCERDRFVFDDRIQRIANGLDAVVRVKVVVPVGEHRMVIDLGREILAKQLGQRIRRVKICN